MGSWVVLLVTLVLSLAFTVRFLRRPRRQLPPGPRAFPILGNLTWLRSSMADFESVLAGLWSDYGPVVTIQLGSARIVLVADRYLAHKMLVQHGAVFADRPPPFPALRPLSPNLRQIKTSGYGHMWRLLRRNLAAEMLHPSRVRQMGDVREWALQLLLSNLRAAAASADGVVVATETFTYTIFCLLVSLCFGEKFEEATMREIEAVQRDFLHIFRKLNVFAYAPKIAGFLFKGTLNRFAQIHQREREIFLPLIVSRRRQKESGVPRENSFGFSYLDSLLDLEISEENGRKLTDEEIISLCSEFISAGTDSTTTALEWIMANIVKHPNVQEKLAEEVGSETMDKDLQKKPYLKAVVLEGLRRHPPTHFVLRHAVTEEISVGGYTIPKDVSVTFSVSKINLDGATWPEPLAFRPERFLSGGEGEGVDLTGSKKIQMMPFGVGRRICPGMGFSLLHLEYFVANLVGEFRWDRVDGAEIDMSERFEFTAFMKNSLRARISPRRLQK